METLNLKQAAELLNIHRETLRQGAKAGEIPGAKIGKSWVFIKEDLLSHIRALYPSQRQVVQVSSQQEKNTWHCTAERKARHGGRADGGKIAVARRSLERRPGFAGTRIFVRGRDHA